MIVPRSRLLWWVALAALPFALLSAVEPSALGISLACIGALIFLAILDAALRKAAAVWITSPGHEPRLVHAHWRDDALWVITGGTEQQVPGLAEGAQVTVTVRSPSTHSHLIDATATAHLTEPTETPRPDTVYVEV